MIITMLGQSYSMDDMEVSMVLLELIGSNMF